MVWNQMQRVLTNSKIYLTTKIKDEPNPVVHELFTNLMKINSEKFRKISLAKFKSLNHRGMHRINWIFEDSYVPKDLRF